MTYFDLQTLKYNCRESYTTKNVTQGKWLTCAVVGEEKEKKEKKVSWKGEEEELLSALF